MCIIRVSYFRRLHTASVRRATTARWWCPSYMAAAATPGHVMGTHYHVTFHVCIVEWMHCILFALSKLSLCVTLVQYLFFSSSFFYKLFENVAINKDLRRAVTCWMRRRLGRIVVYRFLKYVFAGTCTEPMLGITVLHAWPSLGTACKIQTESSRCQLLYRTLFRHKDSHIQID